MYILSQKKSEGIQVLRGIAIIAVVFIHNTPPAMIQVFARPFLNFAVGSFLFLSGMLSNIDKYDPKKRIKKVIVPYIIYTFIYVLMHYYRTPKDIPLLFLKKLVCGNAAAIMYYIFVYCELTLLIPLVDKLSSSKYKFFGLLVSPAEIFIMRLIPLIFGIHMNKYVSVIMNISCIGWFTYFYLGYLLGNQRIKIKLSQKTLTAALIFSIVLQMLEGCWYYSLGSSNCGTQLKLSSVFTGIIFVIIAFEYLESEKIVNFKILKFLGDMSFGIYFSHLAVMAVLNKIPYYGFVFYPLNAIFAVAISLLFCVTVRKVLGKYSKYLAIY